MNYYPIKDLVRADYNPRVMPDSEMQSLMKSIETHGFVEPIVVNVAKDRAGVIVGGHQRLTAVEKLMAKGKLPKGIKLHKEPKGAGGSGTESDINNYEIPCYEVELTLEAEKQLNIGLNKIHGKFEEDKLYQLISEMKDSPTIPTTGFREDEISRLLDRGMEDNDEQDAGEGLPEEARSIPGEIYELGEHRLICGDSTDPETYTKLFGSIRPDMIWTDPPYNVDYKATSESDLHKDGKGSIMNDHMSAEDFKHLIDGAFGQMFRVSKPGAAFYICSGWGSYPQFLASMLSNGFYHSGMIIWVKPNGSHGFNDYKYKHEWIATGKKPDLKTAQAIIYGWSKGKHTFYGDNEFDVWEMPRKGVSRYLHPTEKPDWLPMRAIRNSTKRGDIILDPFGGSGSVMAAAEKTGRKAYMIELDPKFCDVIRDRWARIEKAKNAPPKE